MKKIISIILILCLCGCYNYRELNDLAIISAIGIDKENGEYKVKIQVINESDEEDSSKFTMYESNGKSLQEAFRSIVNKCPKKIYGAHQQILVVSENLAKEGIDDIVDFFVRNPEVRKEFYVFVSDDINILDIITPIDNINSINIVDSLKSSSSYLSNTSMITFNELYDKSSTINTCYFIPILKHEGDIESGNKEENIEKSSGNADIKIEGNVVIKDNKIVDYMDKEDIIYYNFIVNEVNNTLINYDVDDEYVVSEITESTSKISLKDNIVKVNITGSADISEASGKIKIDKCESEMNEEIEKRINEVFNKYKLDIYGFNGLYYKYDYKYYDKHKNEYEEKIFNNIRLEVESKIKIVDTGNMEEETYE